MAEEGFVAPCGMQSGVHEGPNHAALWSRHPVMACKKRVDMLVVSIAHTIDNPFGPVVLFAN